MWPEIAPKVGSQLNAFLAEIYKEESSTPIHWTAAVALGNQYAQTLQTRTEILTYRSRPGSGRFLAPWV